MGELRLLSLLQKIFKEEPDNHSNAVELATLYHAKGDLNKAVAVLKGREKHILNTQAAIILGKFYYGEGDHEKAYELLQPYLKQKIRDIAALEKRYNATYDKEYQKHGDLIVRGMKIGNRKLTAKELETVRSKLDKLMVNNAQVEKIRKKLVKASEVVPLALDLGALRLSKAQAMPPGAAREAELTEVEKQFLAIRSFAGESTDYKYFLGQVYYWLGKDEQAKKIFNDL